MKTAGGVLQSQEPRVNNMTFWAVVLVPFVVPLVMFAMGWMIDDWDKDTRQSERD